MNRLSVAFFEGALAVDIKNSFRQLESYCYASSLKTNLLLHTMTYFHAEDRAVRLTIGEKP